MSDGIGSVRTSPGVVLPKAMTLYVFFGSPTPQIYQLWVCHHQNKKAEFRNELERFV